MRYARPWLLASAIALIALTAQAEAVNGKAAPGFDLPTLSGDARVSLSGLEGKIVVLHFGTGW
jgi:hypothetical protein